MPIPITARACIVLVELDMGGTSALMGLITEEVGQVLGLAEGELLPPPSFGTPIRSEYIAGMAPVGKKFAVMLDIERLLSPSELLDVSLTEATEPDTEPQVSSAETEQDDDWDTSPTEAAASPGTAGAESP